MNATQIANRKGWVEALRSGKYEQGQGALRRNDGTGAIKHCCLGVGCDLLDPSSWSGAPIDARISLWRERSGRPPEEFQEHFGVTREDVSHMISMNDTAKATFFDIASYIESHTPAEPDGERGGSK